VVGRLGVIETKCRRAASVFCATLASIAAFAGTARAEISFDQFGWWGREGLSGRSSGSFELAVANASNRYLVLAVGSVGPGSQVSSVAFGGVRMTFLGASRVASGCRIDMWGLVAPPTGTHTVEMQLSSVTAAVAYAVSYNGVAQAAPTGPFFSAGFGTMASLTVPSAVGDVVFDGLCADEMTGRTWAEPAPQRWHQGATNAGMGLLVSHAPGAASVNMSWLLPDNRPASWVLGAVSLRPAEAPAGVDASVDSAQDAPRPVDGPDDAGMGEPSSADAGAIDTTAGPDASARRADVNLDVGCGCRTGAPFRRPAPVALALALIALLQLRRRLPSPRDTHHQADPQGADQL
jgi:hypothetical protein